MLIKAYNQLIANGKIETDDSQLLLLPKLQSYIEIIDEKESFLSKISVRLKGFKKLSPKGMYIWGDVGRGKSMLVDLFFQTLSTKDKVRLHFHEFMQKVHKSLDQFRKDNKGKSSANDPLPKIVNEMTSKYKVICLDELQINNIADAMLISRIVETIIENGTHLFFTTNRIPDDLYKDGLQRERFLPFIEYVKSHFEVFELENFKDYRMQNLKNIAHAYITPLGANADNEIETAIIYLVGSHEMQEVTVMVDQSKTIRVMKAYGKVAVFSFKELCEIPMGAIDYLALCKTFSTIIIKNIPVLSRDRHNEALRFITLIDCMYDMKTKLICSADQVPEKLYGKGMNAFEFKRTISRLKEMQSEAYILDNVN